MKNMDALPSEHLTRSDVIVRKLNHIAPTLWPGSRHINASIAAYALSASNQPDARYHGRSCRTDSIHDRFFSCNSINPIDRFRDSGGFMSWRMVLTIPVMA